MTPPPTDTDDYASISEAGPGLAYVILACIGILAAVEVSLEYIRRRRRL